MSNLKELKSISFSDLDDIDTADKCIHSIYGYGLALDYVTYANMRNYIKTNRSVLSSALINQKGCNEEESEYIIKCILESDCYSDVMEKLDNTVLEDPITGEESIFTFVAMIITEKTGIRFGFHADYISDNTTKENSYVMFDIRAPWDLTHKERNITEDKLVAIINDVAIDLNLPTAINRSVEVFWSE